MEHLLSVAVDTGGTFTDITLVNRRTGKLFKAKTPSTLEDHSLGFVTGMRRILAETGMRAQDISNVFHGTTVATNTILEMDGAECALLTTTGFRHVLEIGRHDIPRNENIYSWVKPTRPVPTERIYEVDGCMDFKGHELAPLCEEQVRAAIARIRQRNIKAIAVCYLHSYANASHEQRTRDIIAQAYPQALVSLLSEVLPTFREFERSMTTLLNCWEPPQVLSLFEKGNYYNTQNEYVMKLIPGTCALPAFLNTISFQMNQEAEFPFIDQLVKDNDFNELFKLNLCVDIIYRHSIIGVGCIHTAALFYRLTNHRHCFPLFSIHATPVNGWDYGGSLTYVDDREYFFICISSPRRGRHSINIAPGKDRHTENRQPFRVRDPTFAAAAR